MKDAPITLVKGESESSMVQLAKPAAMKDAPTKSRQEESVSGMVQLVKHAAMKDDVNHHFCDHPDH